MLTLARRTLIAVAALAALAGSATAAPLRVVASSVPHAEILRFVTQKLAPDLDVAIIEISGDIRPNALVLNGDADANFFQHGPYLRSEEKQLGTTFAVTAATHIEPLGIYSRKIGKLSEVPAGATVAVPNNVTNLSRALNLLQASGLITLKSGLADGQLATPSDIADNPKAISIVQVAPPQLPRSIDDVTLAVINGNYALEAGLTPATDALALEKAENNPYANIFVTTPALATDPRVQRLSALLASPEVAAFIRETYRGSVIAVHGG
ncbi:MetQ/NlpA family ABC transporter substrate-binding protein [Methylobacterium sp. ID0610]|uniref:MetQ/NlpA family ABC transporter substrate-binding protein n=1 Tax=Methylobacterium carpenticola TaxID=3344827 RepID=UPI0036A041BE